MRSVTCSWFLVPVPSFCAADAPSRRIDADPEWPRPDDRPEPELDDRADPPRAREDLTPEPLACRPPDPLCLVDLPLMNPPSIVIGMSIPRCGGLFNAARPRPCEPTRCRDSAV